MLSEAGTPAAIPKVKKFFNEKKSYEKRKKLSYNFSNVSLGASFFS